MNNVEEKFLTVNKYSRPGIKLTSVKNLIIHWVGNPGTSAIANRNYFESLKDGKNGTYASSQYIIGLNGEIVQCIPENEVAYHAGNLTYNYNSIGIENCHPDWSGKFNEKTYNALIDLLAELCKKYNLSPNKIIRHYDVTGKDCPKYYVENENEFLEIRNKVAEKMGTKIEDETIQKEEFNVAKTYKNGSTVEEVFADTDLTTKIGSLDKYEVCECLDIVDGKYLVKYIIDDTNSYKAGFVKYSGGVS